MKAWIQRWMHWPENEILARTVRAQMILSSHKTYSTHITHESGQGTDKNMPLAHLGSCTCMFKECLGVC